MSAQTLDQWSIERFCEAGRSWDEDQRLALLRLLLVDGLGSVLVRRLLARFGSPREILRQTERELRQVPGIGPLVARAALDPRLDDRLERELHLARRLGARLVWAFDPEYPRLLRAIPSPPLVLFVRGTLLPTDEIAVGVVGSRLATAYGIQQTFRIVGQLAEFGFTIVSGLARGIDGAAHRAALRVRGRTIGVLASGLADIYPPEHFELSEAIVRSGALISEAPMTQKPKAGLFPMRNRIISGLSLGVFVVEAGRRSGAMITVSHALDQGRDVFALPGPVDSEVSRGCHELIREGAYLVESALDIYEVLRETALQRLREIRNSAGGTPQRGQLDGSARRILEALSAGPSTVDELVVRSGHPAGEILRALTRLELAGLAVRLPGARFTRIDATPDEDSDP